MEREEAFEIILDAIAKIQRDVSLMLGAKAVEAEKVKSWVMNHIHEGTYATHADRMAACLQAHELQVEVIDGLTKMWNGLSRNLRAVLNPEPEEDSGVMSFGGDFGAGEQDG